MNFLGDIDVGADGPLMHSFARELFPVFRSISGDGVRQTLSKVNEIIPLEIHEVPTGTDVFDWTVPKEWNIRDAYIKDSGGNKVVDFKKCNLHVVGYSSPVCERMPLSELKKHIFTLPDYPDWIPYRTNYYSNSWGFCLSHNQLMGLHESQYDVCIDSSLEEGFLTYGEYFKKGQTNDEVLISAHVCHPSLANDNLSGIAVATWLAKYVDSFQTRYAYRFLFIPGTIGSITWLAKNYEHISKIKSGLVLACVGDQGDFTYKRSRYGDSQTDRAMELSLLNSGERYKIVDFEPYGYDERQFCSPGINLPVGCFMRSQFGKYPQYHTSADDIDFIRPEKLAGSLKIGLRFFDILEGDGAYRNTSPNCEPQLGRRGLYDNVGGDQHRKELQMAILWVLNLSDTEHSLLDIAIRSKLPFRLIRIAADKLLDAGLLVDD